MRSTRLTRKNKFIILVVYLLVLAVGMLGYRINRTAKIKKLRADLARITAEKNKTSNVEAEAVRLTKLIPAEANSPEFIESLYRCARESGLNQHEVATEASKSSVSARPRPGAADTASITKHRIKVSASGSYRSFAEYVRRVQNIERFNRIIEFRLSPDAGQLKGTFAIELYSLPVKNAK